TLSGFAFAPQRRKWIALAAVGVFSFYAWRWHEARATAELTVLPLNGGTALHCDAPGMKNDLLVNCGNSNSVAFVTKPFLHAQGINHLPRLALTHGETRAVGGAALLREAIPIEQFITSAANFRSPAYRDIIRSLEKFPDQWLIANSGERIAGWTVLHPAATSSFSHASDKTLVLNANIRGTKLLFLSDLGRAGQEALLESGTSLQADIVVAGLPQQGEPLCEALLNAINPKLIVISDSEYPANRRASSALRNRLQRRGIPMIYTRETGAVKFVFRSGTWRLESVQGQLAKSD
ncbi:MAG TPA: hypothetical protein VK327_04860, partial [Candidatus Paceibacterota bacterium]|nr:hypothetical protein [Candidatus Paceibacterota bacterium]